MFIDEKTEPKTTIRNTEVVLPHDIDTGIVEQVFDDVLARSGLTITLRDSLRKYPGCVHWHLKQGRKPGTLELTLWSDARRAWFSVHRGRAAPWIDAELVRLAETLQQQLE